MLSTTEIVCVYLKLCLDNSAIIFTAKIENFLVWDKFFKLRYGVPFNYLTPAPYINCGRRWWSRREQGRGLKLNLSIKYPVARCRKFPFLIYSHSPLLRSIQSYFVRHLYSNRSDLTSFCEIMYFADEVFTGPLFIIMSFFYHRFCPPIVKCLTECQDLTYTVWILAHPCHCWTHYVYGQIDDFNFLFLEEQRLFPCIYKEPCNPGKNTTGYFDSNNFALLPCFFEYNRALRSFGLRVW